MARNSFSDSKIGALLALQVELLGAAQRWSRGAELGAAVDAARHAAVRLNHSRYAELIPAYRQLAGGQDLLGDVDLNTIVNQLLFGDELFKSYQPDWLEGGDFAALSDWLASIFTQPLAQPPATVIDLATWRAWLRQQGVYLSYSSGTSGRLSFVPRDPVTWKALRSNSRAYADSSWFVLADGRPRPYDCLVAGPRGEGMGIQGAATGLARSAARAHFLFEQALSEDLARAPESAAGQTFRRVTSASDEPYRRAFEFVRRAWAEQQPLLIFGAPFQIRRLCEQALAQCGALATPLDSIVVTGGGWKSLHGERLPRHQLYQLIEDAFAITGERVIDAYSTTELNCTFISCAAGRYHIPPLVEPLVLDQAFMGEVGAEGAGTLGFLDPFAVSYPGFIVTGDQVELWRGCCDCGLHGWFIAGEIERAPEREVKGCGGVLAALTA